MVNILHKMKYFLLLLLVGCSTVKVNKPVKLLVIQKSRFQSAVQAVVLSAPRYYYLVWSNSNPYKVSFEVDSKADTNWHIYVIGANNPLSETNVQIYPTNSHELFRVGFR